jgi:hypothetical protein
MAQKWSSREVTEEIKRVLSDLSGHPSGLIVLALRLREDLGFDDQGIRALLGGRLDGSLGPSGLSVNNAFLDNLVECERVRDVKNLVWQELPDDAKKT